MTARAPQARVVGLRPRSLEILRRCYRGQPLDAVIEQALILKAEADGHLKAGKIVAARDLKRGRA
ncbi:hypothetical protein AB0M57_04475 [Streptomyces sp. NPDC051597]|uniref:hypothetical protein n=1 Tax=Streptomyces sp. NPDC051597 TaxID=3155049 RepID=UPI00343252AE